MRGRRHLQRVFEVGGGPSAGPATHPWRLSLAYLRATSRQRRMASWAEFEAAEPDFASRVRALLASGKHLTMATLRRDGSPRISGTEVEFAGDQLRIGSMPRAVKAGDLIRDPTLAIHGPTRDPAKSGSWRGEAKIAGRAREVPGAGDGHT